MIVGVFGYDFADVDRVEAEPYRERVHTSLTVAS